MKIAYLMHSDRKYDEVVETINQLTKQGDHVFIMINDDDLRDFKVLSLHKSSGLSQRKRDTCNYQRLWKLTVCFAHPQNSG